MLEEIRKLLGREPKSYDIHCDIQVKNKSGVKAVTVRVDDKTIDYAVGFPKELSKGASVGVSLPTIPTSSVEGSYADGQSYEWHHYINKDFFEPRLPLDEERKEIFNAIVQNTSGTVSAHTNYSETSEIEIDEFKKKNQKE
jgi:hypothetical protein